MGFINPRSVVRFHLPPYLNILLPVMIEINELFKSESFDIERFLNALGSITEQKYAALGLQAGLAVGYLHDDEFISICRLLNPGGRGSWTNPRSDALMRLQAALVGNNVIYPGVWLSSEENPTYGVCISSCDGRGFEDRDKERDGKMIQEIMGWILTSMEDVE